jgi:hypothetical protein
MGATSPAGAPPKYSVPAPHPLMMLRASTLALVLVASAACSAGVDRVAVYAEVVRHMTTEQGQPSGFRVIYVLDRLVGNHADPDDPAVGEPLTPGERREMAAAVQDVAPVEFVSTRSEVVGAAEEGERVENEGIFLTLGPVSGGDDLVLVPATSYLGNLAASWQTWVVERVDDRWRVTGTEGPVAVS